MLLIQTDDFVVSFVYKKNQKHQNTKHQISCNHIINKI